MRATIEAKSTRLSEHDLGLSGEDLYGEVYSYATVYSASAAPIGFEAYVPYVVLLVRFDHGGMVTARMTDVLGEDVYIGMRVEGVVRILRKDKARLPVYGRAARPCFEADE